METKDWWDELSAEEQAEIYAGLAEADRGETIPHEELIRKYDRWRQHPGDIKGDG